MDTGAAPLACITAVGPKETTLYLSVHGSEERDLEFSPSHVRVIATDQAQILHLARENIDSFVSSIAGQAERDTRKQQLQIAELDWGDMEQSRAAGAPFDLVLVSECVLPKLYPLEPLVTAIDQLCGHPGQGQGADPSVSLSAPVH